MDVKAAKQWGLLLLLLLLPVRVNENLTWGWGSTRNPNSQSPAANGGEGCASYQSAPQLLPGCDLLAPFGILSSPPLASGKIECLYLGHADPTNKSITIASPWASYYYILGKIVFDPDSWNPTAMMFAGMKPSKPGSWPVRFIGLACFLILASTFVFNRSSAQIRPDKHIASSKVSAVKKPIEPIVPLDALDSHINHLKDIAAWKPTKGTKVIGLVFYGRRRFVSILQCYLRV